MFCPSNRSFCPSGRTTSVHVSPTSGAFPVIRAQSQRQVPSANVQISQDTAVAAAGAPRPGHLGLSLKQVERGVIVSDKSTGSPSAYSQRLRVGDQVLKVDDVDVTKMGVQAVREKLDGAPYTTVTLEMKSQDDGQAYECALQRAEAPLFVAGRPNDSDAFSSKLVMDLFPTPDHATVSPHVRPSSGAAVAAQQPPVQQPSPELVPRILAHSPVSRPASRSPPIPAMEPPVSRLESLASLPQQREQGTTTAHQSIGMLLKRPSKSPTTIIVMDVMPGSLADCIIMPGDVLTHLNGIDVTSMSLQALSELLAQSKALRQVICVDTLRQGRPCQVFLDTSLCSSAAPIPSEELPGARSSSIPSVYSSAARSVAPMRGSVDLFASAALSARSSSSSQTQLRGIGVLLLLISDQVQIQKVRPGSNADLLGVIRAGDFIVAIDDESTERRDALAWAKAKILGVAGTRVSLTLQPARRSTPFTVIVVREGGFSTGRAEDDIGYVVAQASRAPFDPFRGTLQTETPVQAGGRNPGMEARDALDLPRPIPMPDEQVQAAQQPYYNSPSALESVLMVSSPSDGNGSHKGAALREDSSPEAQIEQLSTTKPTTIDSRPRVRVLGLCMRVTNSVLSSV